jgi:hypothetical protein
VAAVLGLAPAGLIPAAARADGDPASDVLASQTLFLPADAGVGAAEQAELAGLLSEAARGGHPIRLAVIAGRSDLGSGTALWRRPEDYARFVGQEVALVYRGPLLVVMPDGYGFARGGTPVAGWAGIAARLPSPNRRLGAAAIAVVESATAAAGHPLAPVHAAAAPGGRRGVDAVAWVAFGVGAGVVALAWALSLRARPLALRAPRLSAKR